MFATAAVDWVDDRAALDAHVAAAGGRAERGQAEEGGGDDDDDDDDDADDDAARARGFAAWLESGGAAAAEPELRYDTVLWLSLGLVGNSRTGLNTSLDVVQWCTGRGKLTSAYTSTRVTPSIDPNRHGSDCKR